MTKLPQEVYEAAVEAWTTSIERVGHPVLRAAVDAAFAASPYGDLVEALKKVRPFLNPGDDVEGRLREIIDAVLARAEEKTDG